MKTILLFLLIQISTFTFAATDASKSYKKLNWNGIDVVFIEDNRFPTFDIVMYFADGALADLNSKKGLTNYAFNLLDSGTSKMSQQEILDQLEFYGTDFGTDVTHEYTTFSVSGLSKDINTTMGTICTMLRETNYPRDVLKTEFENIKSSYQSLVSNPRELSERVFREVLLKGTPYSYPVSGKLSDLEKISSKDLREKMDYFLDKVKKRIYLTGPANVLSVEKVFRDQCKLKSSGSDIVRNINYKRVEQKKRLVFIPVPEANQVQVKFGRFINNDEIPTKPLALLSSEFLGGGFTSKLMREVRVKRGLTYSIGSYLSSQKEYGRAGISSFTKNETLNRLIEVIDATVSKIKSNGITKDELEHAKGALMGSYPFKFESNRAFLSELIYLDHVGKSYNDLFSFNDEILKYKETDVVNVIDKIFGVESQTIFILGDKSLLNELKKLKDKYGKLEVLDYKQFI